MTKPFTKSAFKIALECPSKLFYASQPEIYANQNDDNDFLQSLAEGGFQVGELAKLYYHVDADLKDIKRYDEAINATDELLKRDKVTIAEAAFRFDNLFVRADIVVKDGDRIALIEVKAKSFDGEHGSFVAKRNPNSIASEHLPYLYDVAFQKYVLLQAKPQYQIHAYLMMADKSKEADVDNLNQLFKLEDINGRPSVSVHPNAQAILAQSKEHILTAFDVNELCDKIIAGETDEQQSTMGMSFKEFVRLTSDAYCHQKYLSSLVGTKCFGCEYRSSEPNMKDGHKECWKRVAHFTDTDFDRPQVEELWGAYIKRNDWIKKGIYFLDQVDETDLAYACEHNDKPGLDHKQRKWLQIGLATKNESILSSFQDHLVGEAYLDKEGLREEMDSWIYPLHMIDFETTAVALPYYKGMRPYEQVAFQFSHHIIDKNIDGTYSIRHAGQYLNEKVNEFPNFEFLRELKRQLETDKGSVFRYATHENTILNKIREQLQSSTEPDKEELIAFVDSITHDSNSRRVGERDMIDLLEVVKRYYYHYSEMHGSNSIKKVLPAVLNTSSFLQDKYSQPIYGKDIPSCNIEAKDAIAWIAKDESGRVENPYHLLPSVASYLNLTEDQVRKLEDQADDEDDFAVANGGAALTAYSKLMFCDSNMTPALRTALLRYCELDTMAMVFIWEYFYHEI